MDPDFDEHFKLYYFHKSKILSKHDRYINCHDIMDKEKTFKESIDELILS